MTLEPFPGIGLGLVVAWIVIVAVPRGVIQYRRTGAPAMRATDPRGTPQWWSRVVSSIGLLLAVAASVAEILGMPSIAILDQPVLTVLGFVLYATGIAVTLVSQAAMGNAWRGDVDADFRADLVTGGPFRIVRNPILAGTAITATGLMLVVPNVLSLAMLACVLLSIQIQVRLVEEPYLLRVHGDAYRRYAARTGRFVPGLGRLRPVRDATPAR